MDKDFLSYLLEHPEQLASYLQDFQGAQDIINHDLARAQQMQQGSGQHYSSPWGTALGGLGDALGKGVGSYKETQAMNEQRALNQRKQTDAAGRFEEWGKYKRQMALEEFLRNRDEAKGFNQGVTNYWGG